MKLSTLCLVLLVFIEEDVCSVVVQPPVVTLGGNASLRGFISYAYQSTKPVYTFTGIPYAEKPVRFVKAKTLKLWNGERNATKPGKFCVQSEASLRSYFPELFKKMNTSSSLMSEDCLFLHIWTPTMNPNAKLDVMVWIHGGAFVTGSGYTYEGVALTSFHHVVHVAINYRLAGLGLLTTGDENAPGNMVFHDQLEALRWVKRYIHKFGGDPEKVTIFGESAGAMSVSFHLVSPLSRDLFKRAISESGVSTVLAQHTAGRSPAGIALTKKVAKKQGCPTDSNKRMVDCLRDKPASTFIKATDQYTAMVDGNFLLDTPYNLYSTGKINAKDYLVGFNTHEGHMLLNLLFVGFLNNITVQKANQILSLLLVQNYGYNSNISNVLGKEYFGNKTSHDDLYKALVTLFGDSIMGAPSVDVARKHSAKQTTFLYYYNHKTANPLLSRPDWVISDHADEVQLVIGFPFFKRLQLSSGWPGNFSTDDKKVSRLLMSYWTNFAKTGNPNGDGLPRWPAYDCKNKKYLKLNKNPSEAADFQPERMKIWTDVIPKLDKTTIYKGFPWKCDATSTGTSRMAMTSAAPTLYLLLLIMIM